MFVKLGLTFGVELEMLFAYKRYLLEHIHDGEIPDYNLNKNTFRPKPTKPFYLAKHILEKGLNPAANPHGIPAMWGLSSRPLPRFECPVQWDLSPESKTAERYEKWHVTYDSSIVPVPVRDLPRYLPTHVKVEDQDMWANMDLEVVSPVMRGHTGIEEMGKILQVLKGDMLYGHGVFADDQTGLHVNIQVPYWSMGDEEPFDMDETEKTRRRLKYIRELAYVVVIFEQEINRLHPRNRSPPHPHAEENCMSNRKHFGKGGSTYDEEFRKTKLETIKKKLYAEDNDAWEIALLVCGNRAMTKPIKPFIVNFVKAAEESDDIPRIFEFRQHTGTVDLIDIKWWIDFCIRLVSLAVFWADNGCPITSWDDERIDIFWLFETMGLSPTVVSHFTRKIKLYASEDDGAPKDNGRPMNDESPKNEDPPKIEDPPKNEDPPKTEDPPKNDGPPNPEANESFLMKDRWLKVWFPPVLLVLLFMIGCTILQFVILVQLLPYHWLPIPAAGTMVLIIFGLLALLFVFPRLFLRSP